MITNVFDRFKVTDILSPVKVHLCSSPTKAPPNDFYCFRFFDESNLNTILIAHMKSNIQKEETEFLMNNFCSEETIAHLIETNEDIYKIKKEGETTATQTKRKREAKDKAINKVQKTLQESNKKGIKKEKSNHLCDFE